MTDLFFGLFSVVGKGRPNHPLRFLKPIYTTNLNGTIILHYRRNQMSNESTEIELTEGDLRERSQKLDDIQEMYTEMAFMKDPKMPCNECGGTGSVDAGSLGSVCIKCMGARVINQPFYEPMEQPNFKALRAPITAYFDALADRALPAGHENKKGLALPPASSVTFDKNMYNELFAEGRAEVKLIAANETAKQLQAASDDPEDDEDLKPWT